MTRNIKNSGKKGLEVLLGGALALSIFPSKARAVESSGDRYGCVATVEGRYFTDGVTPLKEYPCKVDPAEVARLVTAGGTDKKTDQINFDYLWSQEYHTNGAALTDIRKMGEAAGGRVISFTYPEVCHKGNLEASGTLVKIKEALAFETVPDTAEIAGQIYSVCEPFNNAHYPDAVVERNAENKNQIVLYTATEDYSKKKLMGAVNWLPKNPEAIIAPKPAEIIVTTKPAEVMIAPVAPREPVKAAIKSTTAPLSRDKEEKPERIILNRRRR